MLKDWYDILVTWGVDPAPDLSLLGLVGKSADMRLDRAGSIGLRVGPPQIAPIIQKKRVINPTRF